MNLNNVKAFDKDYTEDPVDFDRQIKAIGSVLRMKILKTVSEEAKPVVVISKEVDLSQPSCSNHINILWRAGLLNREKDGRFIYYQLNKPALINLLNNIKDYLNITE